MTTQGTGTSVSNMELRKQPTRARVHEGERALPPIIAELNWRKHARAVVEFQREIYETNFPGFVADRQFLADYGDQIRRALSNTAEGLFVLEQDGRACGFLWLSLVCTMVDPCVGYIKNIYVAPGLRGQGHARQLMEFAERWCLQRGVRRLALDASCCNQRAVAIYRNAGFDVVRVRMEKALDPASSQSFDRDLHAILGEDDH